nr:MAG TPA: hypothetical protein [Caudoviricetes sp.]DAR57769.1 MAG TPA: hypothetical protein [Caudoviricetes sp.]
MCCKGSGYRAVYATGQCRRWNPEPDIEAGSAQAPVGLGYEPSVSEP